MKNNSFVGDMGIIGGAYLTEEGKCRCELFPFEHPEPPQQLLGIYIYIIYYIAFYKRKNV